MVWFGPGWNPKKTRAQTFDRNVAPGLKEVINGALLITATLLPEMPTTSCYLAAMACGLQWLGEHGKVTNTSTLVISKDQQVYSP